MLTKPAGDDPARHFSRFDLESRRRVAVAVSGGSDSTALLLLLNDHLRERAPQTRLIALTIDHDLRPDSASEARAVGQLCARHGIEHAVRTWTGRKPGTGVPAAAREARHRLLAQEAGLKGTDIVVAGHTADDQAETVLMRQQRDAGRGLAGIAPATLFEGKVWFVRPLLPERRQRLRDSLVRRGVTWIDDPTNASEEFERPRVRSRLGATGGEAEIADALERAAAAQRERERLGEAAASFIEHSASRPCPGLIRLDGDAFDGAEENVAVYALRILLATAGGTEHLPDERRSKEFHRRLVSQRNVRAVLSRCLADRRGTGIFLLREARAIPDAGSAGGGATWDGRYRLIEGAAPAGAGRETARPHAGPPVPESLARAALSREPPTAPAGLLQIPVAAPWARYLPSFDLAPARAVAALLGAPEIPAPPFRNHIGAKP